MIKMIIKKNKLFHQILYKTSYVKGGIPCKYSLLHLDTMERGLVFQKGEAQYMINLPIKVTWKCTLDLNFPARPGNSDRRESFIDWLPVKLNFLVFAKFISLLYKTSSPGSVKADWREPKTCLSWVFNYKLGCFDDVYVFIYVDEWQHL
jgi:hypothetical protein